MLSIIIVNYFAEDLLTSCLQTLFTHTTGIDYEVLIVDNGSDDQKKQTLLDRFPAIEWLNMGYNSGFARANNHGIKAAKGDAFLLLNPDVVIEDDAIAQCYQRFSSSAHLACGVQLLNEDRSPQISGSYFIKGGINHLLPLPVLGSIIKWAGTKAKVKKTSIFQAEGEMEVDWINGAFIMVKRLAIEKAGLLDEDFFLYAEEIEWCARIRRYGMLCIYGDLHVVHLQGEVANVSFGSKGKGYYNLSDKRGRQLMLSNFLRIRKQFGKKWFAVHLMFYTAEMPLSLALTVFSKNHQYREFKGYCSNLFYLWKMSGKILSNKPFFYKVER